MVNPAIATDYAGTLCDYVYAGLVLVPIPAGSKAPTGKGWNLRARCWCNPGQVPSKYMGNVGLAHAYSGTCALDIDNAALAGPALAAYGIDLAALLSAPDAVHIRSGRPGRDKLLFRLSKPMPHVNRSGADGFELRCASKNGATVQDVLPPSIHPDTGQPYQWAGDWRNIPTIPGDLLAAWHRLLSQPATPQPADAAPSRRRLGRIPEGERNTQLLSLAGGLVRRGHDLQAVTRRLLRINSERCEPPLDAGEVAAIAARAIGYGSGGFAALPHKLLDSRQWQALPPTAHDVILMAFRRFDGSNNGNIALTWADFQGRQGFRKKDTFYKARSYAVSAGVLLRETQHRNTQTGCTPDLFAIAPCWLHDTRQSRKSDHAPVPKK